MRGDDHGDLGGSEFFLERAATQPELGHLADVGVVVGESRAEAHQQLADLDRRRLSHVAYPGLV